jgi:hypothetical protein
MIHLLFSIRHVKVRHMITKLDKLFDSPKSKCTTRNIQHNKPGEGYHVLLKHGLIIAHKIIINTQQGDSRIEYDLYILGVKALSFIESELIGNERNLCVTYISALAPWKISATTTRIELPLKPRDWQIKWCKKIISDYNINHRSSIVISGPSGSGKSKFGDFIARQIQLNSKFKIDPTVIKHVDLTSKGLCLDDIITNVPTPINPIILLLDEYDTAINYAIGERKNQTDFSCMAESKPSLLNLLDRLSETKFIVLIATMNESVDALMKNKTTLPFLRKGRFDHHLSVNVNFTQ